jgi:hypothetical protein
MRAAALANLDRIDQAEVVAQQLLGRAASIYHPFDYLGSLR